MPATARVRSVVLLWSHSVAQQQAQVSRKLTSGSPWLDSAPRSAGFGPWQLLWSLGFSKLCKVETWLWPGL